MGARTNRFYSASSRIRDLALASVALVLVLPLMLVLGLAAGLSSGVGQMVFEGTPSQLLSSADSITANTSAGT